MGRACRDLATDLAVDVSRTMLSPSPCRDRRRRQQPELLCGAIYRRPSSRRRNPHADDLDRQTARLHHLVLRRRQRSPDEPGQQLVAETVGVDKQRFRGPSRLPRATPALGGARERGEVTAFVGYTAVAKAAACQRDAGHPRRRWGRSWSCPLFWLDPMIGIRMPPEERQAIEVCATAQSPKLTFSKALRRLRRSGWRPVALIRMNDAIVPVRVQH